MSREHIIEHMAAQINELKAEVERLKNETEEAVSCFNRMESLYRIKCKELEIAKHASKKEYAEKINGMLSRYSHIHKYAEEARRDYIELADGTECEMQSVWDVITLSKNGIADYEYMSRLQENIRSIQMGDLLSGFEKNLRVIEREMLSEPPKEEV